MALIKIILLVLTFTFYSCASQMVSTDTIELNKQARIIDVEKHPNIKEITNTLNRCFDFYNSYFSKKPTEINIYVYRTQKEFINGLKTLFELNPKVRSSYQKSGGSPRPRNKNFLLSNEMSRFSICHEVSHLYIAENYPRFNLPEHTWFEEGLSEYLAHIANGVQDKQRYWTLFKQLKLSPISTYRDYHQWHEHFSSVESKKRIYLQAYIIVAHIINQYGEKAFFNLISKADESSFEQLFKELTGKLPEQYHTDFVTELNIQAAAYHHLRKIFLSRD